MSKVRVHNGPEVEWVTLRSLYPAHMAAEMADAELDSTMGYHEPGTSGSLHLAEFNYLPNASFELHAHDLAEIIYVLDGTIVLGNREMGKGSSIYIDDHTLYGFKAGPQGLRMLIFMASGRVKFWNKKDFQSFQKTKAAEPAA